LTLRVLRLADAVEPCPPAALLGLSLALAAVDFAVVYALGGRSRRAEVAKVLWSAAATTTPFVALALIALDLPFRVFALSQSNVLNQQLRVERGLEGRLIGTWRAASLQKVGEAGSRAPGAVTGTFSRVKGTFPDLRAESSDESVLRGAAGAGPRGRVLPRPRTVAHLDGDPSLDPIRSRPDFRAFRLDLAFPDDPFAR
jgi:hypothetical protein